MDIKKIKFRKIKDFPSYAVSNTGKVVNLITRKVKKQQISDKGYHRVMLYNRGTNKFELVHRLVAKAFLGDKSSSGLEINHIDMNKSNNNVENLEWVTSKYNEQHKRLNTGRDFLGTDNPMSSLDDMQILTIRSFGLDKMRMGPQKNKYYKLLREKYGKTQGVLYRIINNQSYRNLPWT